MLLEQPGERETVRRDERLFEIADDACLQTRFALPASSIGFTLMLPISAEKPNVLLIFADDKLLP